MGEHRRQPDTEDAEVGFFPYVMTVRLKAARLYKNTEKISEHESDDKDTDDRNKGGFFPGIFFRINRTARLASLSFIPGIPANQ